MVPVTVSFAVTREDYLDWRTAQMKHAMTRTYRQTVKLAGAYLLIFSVMMLALGIGAGWPTKWPAAVAAAGGIVLLFLLKPTLFALMRLRAADEFDSGRAGTPSQTVRFYPDRIEVRSERYEASLPYGMLFCAYEDGAVFLLYTGAGECRCVPKRAMAPGDCEKVEALLADRLKQNFIQEGAREWTK